MIPSFLPQGLLKALVIIFAVMFTGNIVMNAFSTSKKEKYIMTPVSVVAALCFAIVALKM